jgi:cell wall-associated NlpC family hydrolase
MPWTDDYIEIPFLCDGRSRNGVDCGGLVILVYKEQLGIDLPTYTGTLTDMSIAGLRRAAKAIRAGLEAFTEVETPIPFDLVTFRSGALQAYHVGIVVNRTCMLHITAGINSSVTPFTGLAWKNKVSGFFRYASN